MADTSDRDRRILSTYMVMRKVLLEKIPVGIEIPDPGTKLQQIDTEASVKYARRILRDMPLDDSKVVGLVDDLIVEWLTALYLYGMGSRRRDPIFGELTDAALTRFAGVLNAINASGDES